MADLTAADTRPSPPVRLHHHAFVTTDQEATRKFYEDIVGLPLVATWTEVEHLMGGEEHEFCHTMYELEDGGCLAFFQSPTASSLNNSHRPLPSRSSGTSRCLSRPNNKRQFAPGPRTLDGK
jgi:catechol 2,3-dioxygenase-like lactoylglutathione lyase family enzyme